MDLRLYAEKRVRRRKHTKLVHEGDYVAEVDVELMDSDKGWGPYLPIEEAAKLDRLRLALRDNDLATALNMARVYRLTPVKATG
jgi:hypothetical protein